MITSNGERTFLEKVAEIEISSLPAPVDIDGKGVLYGVQDNLVAGAALHVHGVRESNFLGDGCVVISSLVVFDIPRRQTSEAQELEQVEIGILEVLFAGAESNTTKWSAVCMPSHVYFEDEIGGGDSFCQWQVLLLAHAADHLEHHIVALYPEDAAVVAGEFQFV